MLILYIYVFNFLITFFKHKQIIMALLLCLLIILTQLNYMYPKKGVSVNLKINIKTLHHRVYSSIKLHSIFCNCDSNVGHYGCIDTLITMTTIYFPNFYSKIIMTIRNLKLFPNHLSSHCWEARGELLL